MQVYQSTLLKWVAIGQGIYYFLTGLWPILHIESFMWITGPKFDIWLVKTVGVLIIAISIAILSAGMNRRISPEIILLAIVSALGLTTIDVYYVAVERIWPVYLLDALAEVVLIGIWIMGWMKTRPTHS